MEALVLPTEQLSSVPMASLIHRNLLESIQDRLHSLSTEFDYDRGEQVVHAALILVSDSLLVAAFDLEQDLGRALSVIELDLDSLPDHLGPAVRCLAGRASTSRPSLGKGLPGFGATPGLYFPYGHCNPVRS